MTALALAPNGVHKPTLSKVIDEWFGNDLIISNASRTPATNIIEQDDHFLIQLSTPGFEKQDFDMEIDQRQLTVSTSILEEKNDAERNYRLREFSTISFKRTFKLSDTLDVDKITAKYENGILSIHIPKKEEAKKRPPKRIDIS